MSSEPSIEAMSPKFSDAVARPLPLLISRRLTWSAASGDMGNNVARSDWRRVSHTLLYCTHPDDHGAGRGDDRAATATQQWRQFILPGARDRAARLSVLLARAENRNRRPAHYNIPTRGRLLFFHLILSCCSFSSPPIANGRLWLELAATAAANLSCRIINPSLIQV